MSENFMEQYGAKLVDAGYRIIPIMPGTKRPGRYDGEKWGDLARWTEVTAQNFHVDIWAKWPGCGIGILTGDVVAIDIDVLDQQVAIEVGNVFQKKLGQTDLIRIGKSPKALYLYRTLEPFSKISLHPIEVLGQGQQFVAYAIHPETSKPYEWPFEAPHEIPLERLPLVTREQVLEAAEEAYKALPPPLRKRGWLALSEPMLRIVTTTGCEDATVWTTNRLAARSSHDQCWRARTRRRSTGGKARHREADLVDGAVEELLFGW
jgi:hypothetical protein